MVAGLTRLLIRRRILVPLMLVVTATTAWAAWSVPGTGTGAAIASPDFHAPSVSLSTIAPAGVTGAGGVCARAASSSSTRTSPTLAAAGSRRPGPTCRRWPQA